MLYDFIETLADNGISKYIHFCVFWFTFGKSIKSKLKKSIYDIFIADNNQNDDVTSYTHWIQC